MSKSLTAEKLIESIKRRGMVPDNQYTFTDERLLAFANEEMSIGILPAILQFHEDYFLYQEAVEMTANQNVYTIPYRAIGNKLRDVAYMDNNGNIAEMTRIKVDDLAQYPNRSGSIYPYLYYVQNNEIVIVPNLNNANAIGSLIFYYYMRPSEIVLSKYVSTITSIDRTTGNVTVNQIPTTWSSNNLMDFNQMKTPNKVIKIDITPLSVNPTTKIIKFNTDDIPQSLLVGDQIALAGETNIVQIPAELSVMLAQRVTTRCLEAMNDTQGLTNANQKLAEMEQKMGYLIDNRVEGSPLKVKNKHGFLRQNLSRRYRRNY